MKKILSIVLGILLCVGCIFAESDAQSQSNTMFNDTINREAEDFVTVSLLTSEPIKGLFSPFGHTAIRLQCPTFDLDYVFHYIMIRAEGSGNETLSYIVGAFDVRLIADSFATYIHDNELKHRGIKEYPLNLRPLEEQKLWRILDEEMMREKSIQYDFFKKGCAVIMAEMVEKAIGYGSLDYSIANPFFNYPQYEVIARQLKGMPWISFIMSTATYGYTNLSYQSKLQAPEQLASVWQNTMVGGRKLASGERILSKHWYYEENNYFTPIRVAILVLMISLISLFVRKDYLDYIILIIYGLMALFVLGISLIGFSYVRWNYLLIPFNLLPFVCWHWRRYWALPYAGLLLLWCLAVLFIPHLLADATHVILAMAFAIVLIKQAQISSKALK